MFAREGRTAEPSNFSCERLPLDGLLDVLSHRIRRKNFVENLSRCCNLNVKSQGSIKILKKETAFMGSPAFPSENAGPFNGKDQQKDVFFRRRSAKARPVPNNLVPLAAIYGILSLPPRPFCPCLPVYLANLAMLQCYTIGNMWEDGILEHCKKNRHTKIFLHCFSYRGWCLGRCGASHQQVQSGRLADSVS